MGVFQLIVKSMPGKVGRLFRVFFNPVELGNSSVQRVFSKMTYRVRSMLNSSLGNLDFFILVRTGTLIAERRSESKSLPIKPTARVFSGLSDINATSLKDIVNHWILQTVSRVHQKIDLEITFHLSIRFEHVT